MTSLYQWLQDKKNYTESEASETIDRYNCGFEIPEEVKRDIREYTEEYIQRYHQF